MAKLADITIRAKNDHDTNIFHDAKYPCTVDSKGIFRADIPTEIFSQIKDLCDRQSTLRCAVEVTPARGGGARHVVRSDALRNVEMLLWEYGKTMVEADVKEEIRIFYTLRLGASYYRKGDGTILPNAQGLADYMRDGGDWHGERPNVGGFSREVSGHTVGVGASIVKVTTVTPSNGIPAVSYDRVEDTDTRLGDWARELRRWTGQPWPSAVRGQAAGMRSVLYDEAGAKLFCDVLTGLAKIADTLETHLADETTLPILIASGAKLLGSS